MQDHRYLCLQSAYQAWSNTFSLSFLLQPSPLPISVATNWLDLPRFANREQFQAHLSPTHPHGTLLLKSNIKHIHSIWVHPRLLLMACWHILCHTWTTTGWRGVGLHWAQRWGKREICLEVLAYRHMALESQTKKLKRRIQWRIPPPLRSLLHSSPLSLPQPSTDQHMWWRMTHLFFYKACVYVKLLKCIKMSSTLGGPPRLPWKITRWKYNFSAGESGIWIEFCLSRSLSFFSSLVIPSFAFSFCFVFFPLQLPLLLFYMVSPPLLKHSFFLQYY